MDDLTNRAYCQLPSPDRNYIRNIVKRGKNQDVRSRLGFTGYDAGPSSNDSESKASPHSAARRWDGAKGLFVLITTITS